MGKVILFISCTLDKYIARENGSVDFLDPYIESGEDYGFDELFQSVSAIVMGNTTFQEYDFYGGGKGCELYVFSRDKNKTHGRVTFVHDSPKTFLKNLKTKKDIWLVGGSKLIESFQNDNLIDEYVITIIPIIIGNGIPLFRQSDLDIQLKLVKVKTFDKSGVVNLYYKKQ